MADNELYNSLMFDLDTKELEILRLSYELTLEKEKRKKESEDFKAELESREKLLEQTLSNYFYNNLNSILNGEIKRVLGFGKLEMAVQEAEKNLKVPLFNNSTSLDRLARLGHKAYLIGYIFFNRPKSKENKYLESA